MAQKPIVIAMAGNPNCGKTSLFNFITGSRQHVGNYPGVTVDSKEGTVVVDDTLLTFVDLPGTYSLSPYSPDESIARHGILSGSISAIIVVVDTNRLSRSLYLVSQIIETGKPVILALNMFDEFTSSGNILDIDQFSIILGVPCVQTVGNRGKGVTELMAITLKTIRGEIPARGKTPRYSHEMEHAIDKVIGLIKENTLYNEHWTAINLLVYGKSYTDERNKDNIGDDLYDSITGIRRRLEKLEGSSVQDIVTFGRYGYASGAVAECLKEKDHPLITTSDKIDSVLTHRWFGLPIFFIILWTIFQATFTLGKIPVAGINVFFDWLGNILFLHIPGAFFKSLVVDGIIGGVGGVVVFLPNILLLFFFISLLEDTGYMARAAFIMDKVMHFLGLHGQSFLPMLVGFGCTVPAIMATRILKNRRERLITMFVLPFMSCGARLPVYILLTGAFFSSRHAGSVIFSIYLVGILLSFFVAKILSYIQPSSSPFVMELPPYRIPTPRSVLIHLWERTYLFVRKAGTIILAASIIVWFFVTFPKPPEQSTVNKIPVKTTTNINIENTYAGKLGNFIEPVLRPLGFDWRIGVALITGFAAKEVVISTLGTIYAVSEENEKTAQTNLENAIRRDPTLNPIKAYALMLFILIYVPCIAVLGVLKREAGGWKWVGLMIVYTTSLAWLISFTFVTIAELLT